MSNPNFNDTNKRLIESFLSNEGYEMRGNDNVIQLGYRRMRLSFENNRINYETEFLHAPDIRDEGEWETDEVHYCTSASEMIDYIKEYFKL
jgi:hypothetical protein